MTKTQVDRLGERLREGAAISNADLEELNRYRLSFDVPYQRVMSIVGNVLALSPTGRPAKTTESIIAKLRREKIRLSQMQDIAGCRVVVSDMLSQDEVVKELRERFVDTQLHDRRESTSHGYRAVHVVVRSEDRPVEIQVRTSLQHVWAEVSEKLVDKFGLEIKYGGGEQTIRTALDQLSDLIRRTEIIERPVVLFAHQIDEALTNTEAVSTLRTQVLHDFDVLKQTIRQNRSGIIAALETVLKSSGSNDGGSGVVSN